jgi:hypothetical protein
MKTCWIWHCCRMEHHLTRSKKLKIGSETFFLNSKSKTNDPWTCVTFRPKKIHLEISKPGLYCQTLLQESWISSGHYVSLPGND